MRKHLRSKLTTVDLPLHQVGMRTGEIAIEVTEKGIQAIPNASYVKGCVVVRESVRIAEI